MVRQPCLIRLAGQQGPVRTRLDRQLELGRRRVDGSDRVRALRDRAHHRAEPDATEADDRDRLPRFHSRRVPDRADPGRHRAADERRDLRRRPRIYLDRGRCGHDLVLAERADAAVRADRLARRPVQPHELRFQPMPASVGLAAQPWFVALACLASPARCRPRQHDQVARFQAVDALADLLDPAGALVAHHHAGRPLPLAVDDVQIGVAHARSRHPDQHLAALRGGSSCSSSILRLRPRSLVDDASGCRSAQSPPPILTTPKSGPYGPPFGISSGIDPAYLWMTMFPPAEGVVGPKLSGTRLVVVHDRASRLVPDLDPELSSPFRDR